MSVRKVKAVRSIKPLEKVKAIRTGRTNFYIKPVDKEIFDWAKKQRPNLSEVIAVALYEYRKKLEKESHS